MSLKKDWCLTIVDFILKANGSNVIFEKLTRVINETFVKSDSRGINFLYKDCNQWGKNLNPDQVKLLNAILIEKFGKDLNNDSEKIELKIKQIIKRGKIVNAIEFEILKEKADKIHTDIKQKELLYKINNLLLEFETEKV